MFYVRTYLPQKHNISLLYLKHNILLLYLKHNMLLLTVCVFHKLSETLIEKCCIKKDNYYKLYYCFYQQYRSAALDSWSAAGAHQRPPCSRAGCGDSAHSPLLDRRSNCWRQWTHIPKIQQTGDVQKHTTMHSLTGSKRWKQRNAQWRETRNYLSLPCLHVYERRGGAGGEGRGHHQPIGSGGGKRDPSV